MRILKAPEPDELAEIKRLRGSRLLAYLQRQLDVVKDSLVAVPDESQIRVLQGQAQALQHIIGLIEVTGKR